MISHVTISNLFLKFHLGTNFISLRLVDLNNYLDFAKNDSSVLFRVLSVI